ncbi:Amuc_1100 family pilus-like protein [Lentisphaera marina]|uniref:Amuc_1100 family pilus-like protein n=1 Tax=Lentisphaera marina TaxID=1111041 RepID=UPI0023660C8E|nr:Amuc_1100 family pilus-like protein [Lentisphaera marina]MDD7983607.1 Amuc_1100 family pilus-like protein [Lentisphaera marina]
MKDKILDAIKDNKANVILLLVVVIVSAVLFKLSFIYKAETKKLQEEKVRLANDTQQINGTQYKLDQVNNDIAVKNAGLLKDGFNLYYQDLMDNYNHDRSDVAKMRSEDVQDKFLESLELLNKVCERAGVVVGEEFKFSFDDEVSRVFQMEPRDKVKVMEQLAAVENLTKIIASSGADSLEGLARPNILSETSVKEAYAKVYTFKLVIKVPPESFGSLLNKITNDKQFYYRINSVSMVTDAQVDKDLAPLLLQKAESVVEEQDKPVAESIDDLLTGVGEEALEEKEEVVEKKPEEKVNIRAFKVPSQTVSISLDWIQFKESYLEK